MLPPKALFDSISSHVGNLLGSENPLPRAEVEAQFKALIQSAFSKLDLSAVKNLTAKWLYSPALVHV